MSTQSIHLRNAELAREQIQQYLPEKGPIAFDKLNINVQQLVNSSKHISSGVPLSMASLIANYTLSNFVSQFQFRMDLDGSMIPPNMVGFLLTGSGMGKDSTVSAQEEAMRMGYEGIYDFRKEKAIARAQAKAEAEDGDQSQWRKHFKEPAPLSNAISTAEGLVSRLNSFARDGIGMPSIYVGELGSELQTNPNITDNIRLLSELYDMGHKKSKAIKDEERQDAEVEGMGMCALFVGSEDNIIMDRQISMKFKTEFVTKLARRSVFVYPSRQEFEAAVVEYQDFNDMKLKNSANKLIAQEAKAFMSEAAMQVSQFLLTQETRRMEFTAEALDALEAYKIYCNSLGAGRDFVHKSVMLEQTHRQWKTLKLAGVYALMAQSLVIRIEHVQEAIYYMEKVGDYLNVYENYASKEEYELLVEYFQNNPSVKLSLHNLKKRGYVTGNTGLDNKIRELVKLADSYAGSAGYLKYENDAMAYHPFESVGEHRASYLQVQGSKQERALNCHSGFINESTTFEKLAVLASNDTAYSPFRFEDGKRSNNSIISGATWIALDIDDGDVTANELHDILGDLNHHIASTSNADNPYKYRVIVEFNNVVDIPVREWKVFGTALGALLGLEVDPATFTKSQIMFGYAGATVLTNLDGEPLDVSQLVKEASEKVTEAFTKQRSIGVAAKRNMLDDKINTFHYAFNAKEGEGSRALYRAWRHAFDLGASVEETEELMNDINYKFWEESIDDERFNNTIIKPMREAFARRDQ